MLLSLAGKTHLILCDQNKINKNPGFWKHWKCTLRGKKWCESVWRLQQFGIEVFTLNHTGVQQKESYSSRLKGHFERNGKYSKQLCKSRLSALVIVLTEWNKVPWQQVEKEERVWKWFKCQAAQKARQWQEGIVSAKFSMRGKLPMVEVLCNPHFDKVSMKKVLASFWSCLRNMLLIPGFETFNRITLEDHRKMRFISCSVITSKCSGLVLPTVQNHLQSVNVISSQW